MDELRRAAGEALERQFLMSGEERARIERIAVDVDLDDQRELVSIRVAPGGGVSWSCTCGERACRHARAALSLVAGRAMMGTDERASARPASLIPDLARGSSPDVRVVEISDQAEGADEAGLAEAVEELITAVVRSGVGDGVSATVSEAMRRLVAAAPEPLPLGISRWVGRLRDAVEAGDVDATARVLEGASRVADDLRRTEPDEAARRRVVSWLGTLAHDVRGVAQISDRTLVEVAREWLPGVERSGIERRYLIDLADGASYREERAPAAPTTSLGPCPRIVNVGLASVETGASPRRLRLLQYAASPRLDAATYAQLGHWGVRTFGSLVDHYREAIMAFPGLAEPFALVAPDSVTREARPRLLDDGGAPLPLTGDDDPSVMRYFAELTRDADPAWVAGRLLDRDGTLVLRPLATGVMRGSTLCYSRL